MNNKSGRRNNGLKITSTNICLKKVPISCCGKDSGIIPPILDQSSKEVYRDLCLYLGIDLLVGAGLLGYSLQNWHNLLFTREDFKQLGESEKGIKPEQYLRVLHSLWSVNGLISYDMRYQSLNTGNEFYNLSIFNSFSKKAKHSITNRVIKTLNY